MPRKHIGNGRRLDSERFLCSELAECSHNVAAEAEIAPTQPRDVFGPSALRLERRGHRLQLRQRWRAVLPTRAALPGGVLIPRLLIA